MITLYATTMERAILELAKHDGLPEHDLIIIRNRYQDYVAHMADTLRTAGHDVSVESEASSPGPQTQHDTPNEEAALEDTPDFWEWAN